MRLVKLCCTNLVTILLFGAGCSSLHSSVSSRIHERSTAYEALPTDQRALVDAGKIKVGMSEDAVYIAWGKPSQIVNSESAQGAFTTWIYKGTHLQEYRYWHYDPMYDGYRRYYGSGPTLESDYYPVNYVHAEVVFQNGVVARWQIFPSPAPP